MLSKRCKTLSLDSRCNIYHDDDGPYPLAHDADLQHAVSRAKDYRPYQSPLDVMQYQ